MTNNTNAAAINNLKAKIVTESTGIIQYLRNNNAQTGIISLAPVALEATYYLTSITDDSLVVRFTCDNQSSKFYIDLGEEYDGGCGLMAHFDDHKNGEGRHTTLDLVDEEDTFAKEVELELHALCENVLSVVISHIVLMRVGA